MQQAPPSKQQQRDALLNQLPPAMRQVFWGYYQARLAEAVAQAEAQASNTGLGGADPYQVEHLVQETLIREAEGRDDPDGLGDVPETAHKVVGIIIPVNDPRSRQQRSASAASGAAAGELSRGRKLGVLALLGALLLMGVWWVWPSASTETGIQAQASPSPRGSASATPSSAAQRTSATPITEVSGGAVQVSDPTSLEFPQERAESTIFTVVASTGERGGPWQPVVDPGTAAWLQGTYINSVFCLPPDAEELLAAAERGQRILLRLANTAVRKYEVVRVRNVGRQQTEVIEQQRAGIIVMQCGAGSNEGGAISNESTVVEALYRPDVFVRTHHEVQETVALADLASVKVQDVHTATDEHAPPGMISVEVRVEVTNLSSAPLAWTDLVDQLEITGQLAEHAEQVTWSALDPKERRTVAYRYLVPQRGGAATWRVTAATGDSQAIQLRVPPRSEIDGAVVTASLAANDVRFVRGSSGRQRVEMTLYMTTSGSQRVTIAPDALSVLHSATLTPLAFTTVNAPVVVEPYVAQPVTLLLDAPTAGMTFIVQANAQRWQVELP